MDESFPLQIENEDDKTSSRETEIFEIIKHCYIYAEHPFASKEGASQQETSPPDIKNDSNFKLNNITRFDQLCDTLTNALSNHSEHQTLSKILSFFDDEEYDTEAVEQDTEDTSSNIRTQISPLTYDIIRSHFNKDNGMNDF